MPLLDKFEVARFSVGEVGTRRLNKMFKKYRGRWVLVSEALPPERLSVLVMLRGDDCPAFAWLKYAAGDRECPYFVCPQRAAMKSRNLQDAEKDDVTHWYVPSEEDLPRWGPKGHKNAEYGLDYHGLPLVRYEI